MHFETVLVPATAMTAIRSAIVALALVVGGCSASPSADAPDGSARDANSEDSGLDGASDTSVPAPRVKWLSAGSETTCAVLVDGTIRCFGRNDEGQLGNGARSPDPTVRPVTVVGITDAVAVSAGVEYACALRAGGTVVCWGSGASGVLGNGASDRQLVPVPVSGLNGVAEIAAGYAATCALKSDGTVWCWGRGGDIGLASLSGSSVPVQVGGLSGVAHLANANEGLQTLSSLVCALKKDDTVLCFSSQNLEGQLGTGTQDPSRTPVAVQGIGDATTMTASLTHACAVRADGTYCWGAGRLVGDGTLERRLVPTRVSTTRFVELSSGLDHTCGRDPAGDVLCWGVTTRGQAGDGALVKTNDARLSPTKTLVADVELLSAGMFHTCAYTRAGKTLCWGANGFGELGSGAPGSSVYTSTPTEVVW